LGKKAGGRAATLSAREAVNRLLAPRLVYGYRAVAKTRGAYVAMNAWVIAPVMERPTLVGHGSIFRQRWGFEECWSITLAIILVSFSPYAEPHERICPTKVGRSKNRARVSLSLTMGSRKGLRNRARVFLDLSKPSGSWYNRIGCYADCINIFDERDNRLRRFNLMMGFAKEKPKM